MVRSEAGETLIEVLLALIILALASVAMMMAFGTDISASAEHRSLAKFDTVLASSIAIMTSEVQQQYAAVFTSCPTPAGSLSGYPSSAVLTADVGITGYTASIAASGTQPAVEYYNGTAFTPTCDSSYVGGPQIITVVVTDTATRYSQSSTVVVLDPTPVQVAGSHGTTANQLVFMTQPQGATVGSPFITQPRIEVQSCELVSGVTVCSLVTTDLSPITLTITSGSGTDGASLSTTCSGVETSGVVVYSGCSINEVGTGYQLTATEPAPSGTGVLTTTSAPFSVYSSQLATPIITKVAPSAVTAGAINVTFTGSANAPPGETYSIKACTDIAMSANCVTQANFTSGSDLAGLVPGTNYYVQITATASSNFLASTSPPSSAVMATVQLTAPGAPALGYGPVAGSLSVTFTGSPNAPGGQTYTVKACTNGAMTTGCVTNANFTSSTSLTGLAYVAGGPGTLYYVQVTANASTGYLASLPSAQANHQVTSPVKTPTGFSAAPSASQSGAITASFIEPSGGTGPTSFTVTACTDSAMTVGCVTATNYTSGAQLGGLTAGTSYYVQVTAVTSAAGYVSATTAVSPATVATVQLAAPTGVTLGYGTVAGSLSVAFTPPGTVAAGQTYTVKTCTNGAMTTGCVTNTNFTSGTSLTGLAYVVGSVGTTYYVQVTANGSSGYLVSPPSTQASHADMSQVGVPGTPTAASSTTTAGAIVVTFTASPGTAPFNYTATACTNAGMTSGCVTVANYTSGAQLGGLTPGTNYFVQITAVAPTGYVNNNSVVSAGSTLATVQLAAPTGVTVDYGTVAGSVSVAFTPPGTVAVGQTYTVKACTNNAMNTGCVSNANFTSGSNLTGLAYVAGVSSTTYYVQVTANASTGYLASPASPTTPVVHAASATSAPGTPTATSGPFRSGTMVVNFTGSSPASSSYTAVACTDSAMSAGCVTMTHFTSGSNFTGLISRTYYYVQITAVAPSGSVNNISAVSAGSTRAG